jgi:hypothetical protein
MIHMADSTIVVQKKKEKLEWVDHFKFESFFDQGRINENVLRFFALFKTQILSFTANPAFSVSSIQPPDPSETLS